MVDWLSLLLLWDGLLSKQLSPEDVSLGVSLLCNVDFNSSWAP